MDYQYNAIIWADDRSKKARKVYHQENTEKKIRSAPKTKIETNVDY